MKIFCIGLSKTATTAVSYALAYLGYTVKHYPLDCFYLGADGKVYLNPQQVARYDGISDTVAARFFKELDCYFPDSLFIYTTRELESWLQSCQNTFWYGQLFKQRDKSNQLHYELYSAIDFDREGFKEGYLRHHRAVYSYFKGRQDFLVMDISKGAGWDKLCSFLGVEKPSIPFPQVDCFWAGFFKKAPIQRLRDIWPFYIRRRPSWD
ncbi:MAG: sulfotransferase family protein [Nanobdellota archaeon]